MASEATSRDPAEVPGLSPLPPVHMELRNSWQSIPDDAAEVSSNKTMDAAVSATADDAEVGNTKLGSSVSGGSSIVRVFSNGNPDYHNVGAYRALFTMVKTQIGIGALSLPLAYDKVGLIPGIFCLNLVAVMAAFACYQIGQAKRRHLFIRTFEDLGHYLFGKWGREVFGAVYCLYFAFTTASAIQALSVGFNALSDHGTCTVTFKFLALAIVGALASFRTLGKISWLAIFGVGCILSSLLAVVIATAVQERPPSAPAGPWKSDFKLFGNPSSKDVMSAMGTFIFSYSGIMAYFLIQDEMKNQKHYNKTMFSSIAIIAIVYTVASAVVYFYCGSYVSSPALGSAGGVMKKVCYGLATPGLIVTGIIVCHLTIKYLYFRITGENRKLPERADTMDSVLMRPEEVQPRPSNRYANWRHRHRNYIWISCTMTVLAFAFVIANVIPYFDNLITLIGALLGTFMLCLPMAYYWLYDNWSVRQRNLVWWLTVCWCVSLLVFGAVFLVGGTYAASDAIWSAQHNETAIKPFSCDDNSVVEKRFHH